MRIITSEFVKSSATYKDCPKEDKAEYAFIGRSNVGKSSLINMIVTQKNLAKTSSRPGKTQLINHFIIDNKWYIADLPGFGFAKVPVKIKNKWIKMIRDYLKFRRNLVCSFLLIDSRHLPQKNDLEFMEWFAENQIPFVLAFTKTDKLGNQKLSSNVQHYLSDLSKTWDPLPQYFITSSETHAGKEEILKFIDYCNKDFEEFRKQTSN